MIESGTILLQRILMAQNLFSWMRIICFVISSFILPVSILLFYNNLKFSFSVPMKWCISNFHPNLFLLSLSTAVRFAKHRGFYYKSFLCKISCCVYKTVMFIKRFLSMHFRYSESWCKLMMKCSNIWILKSF